ncbi:MAG TPA: hypothetical protein V6C65_29560 [Allocoleopsis sp.]
MTFSVAEVIQSWHNDRSSSKVNSNLLKHLCSALKLYLLDGLGYATRAMSSSEFSQFLSNQKLETLAKSLAKANDRLDQQSNPEAPHQFTTPCDLASVAIGVFDSQFQQAVAAGQTKKSTGNNYRSAITRFFKWLSHQTFWQVLGHESSPQIRPQRRGNRKPPCSGKKRLEDYGLKEMELSISLQQELSNFLNFRVDGGDALWRQIQRERRQTGQREGRRPKLDRVTSKEGLNNEKNRILRFFGWQVNIEQTPLEQIQFDSLTDSLLIDDYTRWLVTERNRTHLTGIQLLNTGIAILKWRNFSKTRRQNWSDIEEIEELRDYRRDLQAKYRPEHKKNSKAKWKQKVLTHEQLQQVCAYLRSLCVPYTGRKDKRTGQLYRNRKRTDSAIVWDWQVYLIVSIFTYAPVRQQEPRQYQDQVTLVRQITPSGEAVYVASGIHDKNKKRRGDTREYQLPAVLTADLDLWINHYRPLAVRATQSREAWLEFTRYKPDELEKLKQRLANAQQGIVSSGTSNTQIYVQNLQKKIRSVKSRTAAWETAKANLETNDLLFFSLGKSHPGSFGKPLSSGSIISMVKGAVAEASLALFGRECRLNPHGFRHIAALHVRLHGGEKLPLSCLMGHEESMGDSYAEQVQDDIAVTAMADNWWINPKR